MNHAKCSMCAFLTHNIHLVSSACMLMSSELIRALGSAPLIRARMIYSVTRMFTLAKCSFLSIASHNAYKPIN